MSNSSSAVLQSHVDLINAHQDTCTAKLQEQILVMIGNQEKIYQQLLEESPAQTQPSAIQEKTYQQFLLDSPVKTQAGAVDMLHLQEANGFDKHEAMQPSFSPLAKSQGVESAAALAPRSSVVDNDEFPEASQTVACEKADDKPGGRHSEKQVSFSPETCALRSVGSCVSQMTEVANDEFGAKRGARINQRVKKAATRDSVMQELNRGLASPPRRSFLNNVNTVLVRGTTHKANALKLRSSENLGLPQSSQLKKFVSSSYFDWGCALMLITNAFFIGMQVEYAAKELVPEVPLKWTVVDYIYGIWFIIELLLRLRVAGLSFFLDPDERTRNIFDSVIVITSSIEMVFSAFVRSSGPWKTLSMARMVRVARIVRITRIVRVLRFFRPLRILLKAIFSTLKSCVWAAMLFFIILYMFGIIFVQGTTEYRIEVAPGLQAESLVSYYGSLPRGIFTLFKACLGGLDWDVAISPLSDVGELYIALFILMISFMYLAVINVISALFLQGAIDAGHSDREDRIQTLLLEKKRFVQKAVRLFQELDDNSDGQVTFADFVKHLQEPRTIGFLNSLEIDIHDAWSLFALLDVRQGGAVTLDEFVEGCLNVKGDAKSIHTAQILYESKWLMDTIFELVDFIDREFELVQQQLTNLNSKGQREEQIATVNPSEQLANLNSSEQFAHVNPTDQRKVKVKRKLMSV